MNKFIVNRRAAEAVLYQKCMDVGITYEVAPPNESRKQQFNRRRRIKRRIKSSQMEEIPIVTDVSSYNINNTPGHITDVGSCRIIDNRQGHHGKDMKKLPFYIYIHQMKSRLHNITMRGKTRHGQLGDLTRIRKQITVLPSETFMYATYGDSSLGEAPHGSALVSKKEKVDATLQKREVENVTISKCIADSRIYESDGCRVVYDDNEMIEKSKDIRFETELVRHFLDVYSQSDSMRKNKNRDGVNSLSRCDGGFLTRYPPDRLGITETVNGEKIPKLKCAKFRALPPYVLAHLFEVILPMGQKFLDESDAGHCYPDNERYLQFAKKFNEECGFADAETRFEYVDIMCNRVGECDQPLMRHIDGKNCFRKGYSGTVVYSFHKEVKGILYKCSIVMASRTVCGAAMDRIRGQTG